MRFQLFPICFLLMTAPLWAQPPLSFLQRDLDQNGRLIPEEAGLSQQEFQRYDRSGNGQLSLGEFGEYWETVTSRPALGDIKYGEESSRQLLDLYLPTQTTEGAVPVLIWIHGGSWREGDKRPCPFKTLTNEGIAVAAVNYRLTGEAPFPAQIDDCSRAVLWLRHHAEEHGLDSERMVAAGLSAGGHLSLLLGNRKEVAGVVSFGAPTDLYIPEAMEAHRETLERLVGSPLETRVELLKQASPCRQVPPSPVPTLLYHGLEDRRLPYQAALLMAGVLAEAGGTVSTTLVKDGSHTVVGGPGAWKAILELLKSLGS